MRTPVYVADAIALDDAVTGLNEFEQMPRCSAEEKEKWIQQLKQLNSMYNEVSSFAHEFDYSASLRYNGLRSYMKMLSAYFADVSKTLVALKSNANDKKEAKKLQILRGQAAAFVLMGKSMTRVRQIWAEKGPPSANNRQFTSEALESRIEMSQELDSEMLFNLYHLKYLGPWFPKWVRKLNKNSIRAYYLAMAPRSLLGISRDSIVARFYANEVDKFQIDQIRKMTDKVCKSFLFNSIIWTSNLLCRDLSVSTVTLDERQSDYFIDKRSKAIGKNNGKVTSTNEKSVDCMFIKPRDFTSGNLLLHIHGGAYIVGDCKSQIPHLRQTIRESNAALLSIDYSLSPESKYPIALQECLDVYLNLLSNNPITGFKPNKIIFLGESSGGHSVIALAIAIAELRVLQKSLKEPLTPFPNAVVSIFPVSTICIGNVYPSWAIIESNLVPPVIFEAFNAYCGPLDECKYSEENNGAIWFKDAAKLREVGQEVNSHFDDPFINLIGYKHFDRLANLPLYLQVGEFDVVLDDSIHLAKCWKGKVVLDIIPEVPHGWSVVESFAPKTFTGCNLMRQRIVEAIDCTAPKEDEEEEEEGQNS